MVSGLHFMHLVKVNVLSVSSLLLLRLNLILELFDLGLQTLLEVLLHFSIFLQLLSRSRDRDLKLLSCILALTNEILILGHVFFKIIKNLKLLI